jgi:hypothetical protein
VFSGAELPYSRLERQMGYVDGCVKYPDAHVEDCDSHLSVGNLHQSMTRACSPPPSLSPIPQSLTRNLFRVNRNKPLTWVPVVCPACPVIVSAIDDSHSYHHDHFRILR